MKFIVVVILGLSFMGNTQVDYSVKVTKLMALADDCDGGGFCLSAPQDPIFNIWVTDEELVENHYCWVFDNDDNQEYGEWNDIPDVEIATRLDAITNQLSFDLGGFESDNLNPGCSSSLGDDEIYDRQFIEAINFSGLENGVVHIDTISVGGVFFFEVEILYNDYASLNEIENQVIFSVQPNPSEGLIQINVVDDVVSEVEINITDMSGRIVETIQSAVGSTQIDISNQKAGIYFVSVHADGRKSTKKVVLK